MSSSFREYYINFNSFASWLNNGLGLKDRHSPNLIIYIYIYITFYIHYITIYPVLLQEAGFKTLIFIDMNVFKFFLDASLNLWFRFTEVLWPHLFEDHTVFSVVPKSDHLTKSDFRCFCVLFQQLFF